MLDFANGGISEVAGVTPAIPVAKPLPGDEILVSSDMRLGIRVDGAGMPMPCAPLSWTDNPSSVAFCHPYVLAVIEGQHIEVHSIASPGEAFVFETNTFENSVFGLALPRGVVVFLPTTTFRLKQCVRA